MAKAISRWIKPFRTTSPVLRSDEQLAAFVWRASGVHQFYAGAIAIGVALLNFAPIDLQRRIVDDAIAKQDVTALLALGALYLAIVAFQGALKYTLLVYQGWVGESAIKASRDQLAAIAAERFPRNQATSGRTVNVIGREIDGVGGFVGTTISDLVVNFTLIVVIASYMVYIEPVIALCSALLLAPQIWLALSMQRNLNVLFARQVKLVRRLGDEILIAPDVASGSNRRMILSINAIFRNRLRFYILKYGLKTLLNAANSIGPLMVLSVGGYLAINGQTTIGTLVAFVSGFERLSGPLRDLLNFYREYQQAKVQHRMIAQWAAPTDEFRNALRMTESCRAES